MKTVSGTERVRRVLQLDCQLLRCIQDGMRWWPQWRLRSFVRLCSMTTLLMDPIIADTNYTDDTAMGGERNT